MKRHTKSPVLDMSIREDRLEHDRIQLEHNLQHTDLSLHLSSQEDDASIEYPRHNSAPSPFPDFISFPRHDHDNMDASQLHAWSYRTGDDEDGISPYGGGETVSTAAHHASALTLNAGLGGRAARREISLSGAEYDPDRPLHGMMAAVDPKLSMFDMDPSRSRYEPPFGTPAQLDRVLQSGHAPSSRSRSVRIRSPHSSSTSSDSEAPRSRLADALQRVALSPKRPRSPQTSHQPNHRHAQVPPSPLARSAATNKADDSNLPTPRPSRRNTSASTPASQFTRAARGLTRDLVEQQQAERNPFHDIANRDAGHPSKSRMYLPDVTGLTSAVESPAKAGGAYGAYAPHDDRPRDSEARLLSVLSVVQTKLHQLEDENSISRRRVRELELELEACKREVVKERTRILEMEEEVSVRGKGKGKGKAPDPSFEDMEERYREVVEEKKALESLISTLRTHLTRLTSELSAHQELLTELRQLREQDARTLKEKSGEVERLRREVERLGGEVEVLRGVVEEGLRERRAAREEVSESQSAADVAMSADLEESEEEEELPPEEDEEPLDDRSQSSLSLESDEEDEESEAEPFDPVSILGSSRAGANGAPDRTLRTDHATRGSPSPSGRFGGEDELARIGRDVDERRSNLSGGSSVRERSPQTRHRRAAMVEEVSDAGTEVPRVPSPSRPTQPPAQHRPAGPTPGRARQSRLSSNVVTPFPQIRGEHLERLFFSAPPHNARTCTVCCRRRGHGPEPESWVGRDLRAGRKEDDDEGFADGEPDEVEAERERERARKRLRTILGKSDDDRQREDRDYEAAARKAGLPPQTIVTRVIRELEDDFTHYKSVYVELADQYKEMDAVSDVPKRNMLAKHLREVVDILEQKGDQIASLYDCLTFKDKPLAGKR
ncbi:hypothetical protein FB45DRAFT_1053047 [Roridomyces roridus]|uniref:Cep57 centrosome microtubule-binding domain-containing protein n=1 Tax=Roridomyces roridus TaxID=1738132 RepID=A0AAD7CBQ9_9AGAR|nr:hypothetical protein FB45DRAFT_1053047 [Roridomyces roridus]